MNNTSASEQIRKARKKLEERFAAFEKAILADTAVRVPAGLPDSGEVDAHAGWLEEQNRQLLQEVNDLKAQLQAERAGKTQGEQRLHELQSRLHQTAQTATSAKQDNALTEEL